MQLPKVGLSYAQERLGINALQNYAANTSQIWRETSTGDVGIDGNLEFVNPDGFATGKVIAVQVKSGPHTSSMNQQRDGSFTQRKSIELIGSHFHCL